MGAAVRGEVTPPESLHAGIYQTGKQATGLMPSFRQQPYGEKYFATGIYLSLIFMQPGHFSY
jgi:hypothetical protein